MGMTRACLAVIVVLTIESSLHAGDVKSPVTEVEATEIWLAREPGVAGAAAVVDAMQRLATSSGSARHHAWLARAWYWMGVQQTDAGAPAEARLESFSRGVTSAETAERLNDREPGAFYWQAVNRAKAAELRGIVASVWQLPALKQLMQRAEELSPGYAYGGTYRYWGAVIARTPTFLVRLKGQSLDDGERYFKESLKIAPDFLGTLSFWAELEVKRGDVKHARQLLTQVLSAPPSTNREIEAWNRLERIHARAALHALDGR